MSDCSVFDNYIIEIIKNNISLFHLDLNSTFISDNLIYNINNNYNNYYIIIKSLDIRNCQNINKSYLSIIKLILNCLSLELVLYGNNYCYNRFD